MFTLLLRCIVYPVYSSNKFTLTLAMYIFGRFSKEAKQKRNPYCFLPFGTGPRSCIGMRFALMEAKMALVYLLKRFRFQKNADTEVLVILVLLEVTRYS